MEGGVIKLGRLPSSPDDLRRRLKLHDYVDVRAIAPGLPANVDHTQIRNAWGELGNDTTNDCPVAAAGHAIEIADWYGAHAAADIPTLTERVLAAYGDMTGNVAGSDPGIDMGATLKYWQHAGIDGRRCDAYVAFDPLSPDHWRTAIYLFGFAYIGLSLPKAVIGPADRHTYVDWTDTSEPQVERDDNGHAAIAAGYDADGLRVVTWGTVVSMSWEFASKYTQEAYAVLLPSWATGNEPGAFDLAQLEADLGVVQGGGAIAPAPSASAGAGASIATDQGRTIGIPVAKEATAMTETTGAPGEWGAGASPVNFLALLKLTKQGRNQSDSAARHVNEVARVLSEAGGVTKAAIMTYGRYDAVIVGGCPDQTVLTGVVAWINEQGYFATETLIGVDPATFEARKHRG